MNLKYLHGKPKISPALDYYCGFPAKFRIISELRILTAVATAGRVRASINM